MGCSWPALQLPGTDVGIHALAVGLAIGAEREDIDFTVGARVEVLIRTAPRIVRQAFQVRAPVAVLRVRRALDQHFQALVLARVVAVIEAVQLQGLHQAADVLLRRGGARLVRTIQHLGHHHRGENPEDHHHDHDLDQREALLRTRHSGRLNRLFELHDIHLVIPWLDSIRRAVLQEDMSGMLKFLGSFRRQAVKDGGYGQGLCFGSGPFMPTRSRESGFTLIEVLVALAIIAVAMSAAVRVAGLMTQSSGLLRDRSIAMIAAQSRMAELRLEARLPLGMKAMQCDQGRLLLRCEQVIGAAQNGRLLRVGIQVFDRSQDAPPLARIETLLSRTESP